MGRKEVGARTRWNFRGPKLCSFTRLEGAQYQLSKGCRREEAESSEKKLERINIDEPSMAVCVREARMLTMRVVQS